MAKSYDMEVFGQPSLYEPKERKFKMYMCEPDKGVNKDTGILLLIAGYGGSATSNVYIKMRQQFADKYNLVTVQCDYFGYKYMQDDKNLTVDVEVLKSYLTREELNKIASSSSKCIDEFSEKKKISFNNKRKSEESYSDFNDMGLIQAMDNLTAVSVVTEILKENGLQFNSNKIIAYGHSHGAYIAYLCNGFTPNVFTGIIDNSSYIYPYYLKNERYTVAEYKKWSFNTYNDYIVRKIIFDEEVYYLTNIYNQFKNDCNIISFIGEDDNMTNYTIKRKFVENIHLGKAEFINSDNVDNVIFKSTKHGLNADYIKMFEYVMKNYDLSRDRKNKPMFTTNEIETKKYKYICKYIKNIPVLEVVKK